MTPERAQEILAKAKGSTKPGPWVDQIEAELQPGEKALINAGWDLLPGHTNFVDALQAIAEGRVVFAGNLALWRDLVPPDTKSLVVFQNFEFPIDGDDSQTPH